MYVNATGKNISISEDATTDVSNIPDRMVHVTILPPKTRKIKGLQKSTPSEKNDFDALHHWMQGKK